MAANKPVEVLRFANRVPLMYQQGGCLLTKAIESVDWRQYGLDQAGGKGSQRPSGNSCASCQHQCSIHIRS